MADDLVDWLCGRFMSGRFIWFVVCEACDWKIYLVSCVGGL